MTFELPEGEAADNFRKLVALHPGYSAKDVLINALTFYHFVYDLILQGQEIDVKEILDYLEILMQERKEKEK